MSLPAINQYVESVGDPLGRLRTLPLPEAERDAYGRVRFCAGRNAVVFGVTIGGQRHALKCYTRSPGRTAEVCGYMGKNPSPLLQPVRYLAGELWVFDHRGRGAWYDVAVAPWAEGATLEDEIRRAAVLAVPPKGTRKRKEGAEERGFGEATARFARLAGAFDTLVAALLHNPWAHGDLKPANIVVGPDGRMTLIDPDALFIPPLAGQQAVETGTPAFRHPSRDASHYDRHLDDYPIALISAALHALALDPTLAARHSVAEGLLFDPGEVLSGRNRAWDEAKALDIQNKRLQALLFALKSPAPRIEGLAELFPINDNTPCMKPI